MASKSEDFLVDCMISAGELDGTRHRFLNNELKVVEVAKHNVPYSEFLDWISSPELQKRKRELEFIGREKFGRDYCMKYCVCYFCTSPHKD